MCAQPVVEDEQVTVGFIGLGRMGAPMATRLCGWPGGLLVHDVRPGAAAPLAASGAEPVPAVAALAARADVVSVMVRDDDQAHEVVDALAEAARPGTVVAVHSTVHPRTVAELGERCDAVGVHLLDAPVSGGAAGAGSGRLALLVGGERAALDRCRGAFGRMADLVVHFGPLGAGTRAKLARNLVNFTAITAVVEGARLAQAAGVDVRKLARVTLHSDAVTGGPGAVMLRGDRAPLPPDDPLRPVFEHTHALGAKDLALALELAASVDLDLPVAEAAATVLADHLGVAGGGAS